MTILYNKQEEDQVPNQTPSKVKNTKEQMDSQGHEKIDGEQLEGDEMKQEIPGEIVTTATVARGGDSTIHTDMQHLHLDKVSTCVLFRHISILSLLQI